MLLSCAKEDVAYRNYGDIGIIYNLKCNTIITLENVALDIWEIIYSQGSVQLDEVTAQISSIYKCLSDDIVGDITEFAIELYDEGIVSIDGRYFTENNTTEGGTISGEDLEGEILQVMQERDQLYSATIELTYACNEQCIHCYANYPESAFHESKIAVDDYRLLIDELYAAGCMHISLTGGDPFMNKDFMNVFEYARDKGFVCDIYTNGLYLAEHPTTLARIAERHVRTFYISLYGASAETHDRVTAVRGSFDKTIHAIKEIHRLGIPVVLNVMLLSVNYQDAAQIVRLADELDVQYRVGMSLIYRNNGDSHPMNFFINDKDAIKSVLRCVRKNFFSFDQSLTNIQASNTMCGAGSTSLSIAPDGTVYPCISLKVPLGNIASDTIDSIWSGEKRKRLVDSLRWENTASCKTCHLLDSCPHCIGISEAETGNMFSCNTCDRMIAECNYELSLF